MKVLLSILFILGSIILSAQTIPSNLIIVVNSDQVELNWDDVPEADKYRIYRSSYSDHSFSMIAEVVTSSYVDGTASSEDKYFYYVTSVIVSSNPFDWCTIPAGDYTFGNPAVIQNINYNYQIMKYEVTSQQYVDFLHEKLNSGEISITADAVLGFYPGDQNYSAGNYVYLKRDVLVEQIFWSGTEFTIDSGYENHPVVNVTWFGAWAFADHYDLRLPTEQEWEKAARGITGYDYPWGNTITGQQANYSSSGDPFEQGILQTTPVGMYNGQTILGFTTLDSPSPFGVYDMAGNVCEWTDSWYNTDRIIRGGCFVNYTDTLKSWLLSTLPPTGSPFGFDIGIGFRCVNQ